MWHHWDPFLSDEENWKRINRWRSVNARLRWHNPPGHTRKLPSRRAVYRYVRAQRTRLVTCGRRVRMRTARLRPVA